MRCRSAVTWTLALLAAGCGRPSGRPLTPDDEATIELNDVAEMYRVFTADKHKPPEKLADFQAMEPMSPMGVRAVETGSVVVRYGAVLPDTEDEPGGGPGDEVLAYQKQVPGEGGKVLMLNRTVRAMTPEGFRAAKLAGTASSEPPRTKARGR